MMFPEQEESGIIFMKPVMILPMGRKSGYTAWKQTAEDYKDVLIITSR